MLSVGHRNVVSVLNQGQSDNDSGKGQVLHKSLKGERYLLLISSLSPNNWKTIISSNMFANQLRSNITKSINMSSKRLSSSIVPVSSEANI